LSLADVNTLVDYGCGSCGIGFADFFGGGLEVRDAAAEDGDEFGAGLGEGDGGGFTDSAAAACDKDGFSGGSEFGAGRGD